MQLRKEILALAHELKLPGIVNCFDEVMQCGATLLVNMSDIEPRKEDDGFDGAFLSP